MNVALGLLSWQLLLTGLALALAISTGRQKLPRKQRVWQLVCALSLVAGAVAGLVPVVGIANLFNGVETLLAFGPPTMTLAICGALVIEPAPFGRAKETDGRNRH